MIKAVIFDFDGTLADLFDQHLEAFQQAVRKHFNMEFTREDLDAGYGMAGEDILGLFFKKHGLKVSKEKLRQVVGERRSLAAEKIGGEIKLLPGAEKLMDEFKKAGLKTAVATSCSKNVCGRIFSMKQFSGRLDATTNNSEVEKGKPNPEIFLKTAGKLEVRPEECLVFEDSAYGVKAGKQAGMKVVAVTTGHDSREKLAKENPDSIIGSLLEFKIKDLLNL